MRLVESEVGGKAIGKQERGCVIIEERKKMAEKKEKLSLSERVKELDAKVEWFYSDEFRLEEATEKYRQAMQLAKEIEEDLAKLQNEIEVLSEDFGK